MSLYTFS